MPHLFVKLCTQKSDEPVKAHPCKQAPKERDKIAQGATLGDEQFHSIKPGTGEIENSYRPVGALGLEKRHFPRALPFAITFVPVGDGHFPLA